MDNKLTLKLDNVCVTYTTFEPSVLRDKKSIQTQAVIDFCATFEPGKIYGFIGRNSAGKTSLLSVASGYRAASGGSATINGQPLFENTTFAPHIIFVYQRELSDEYARVKKFVKRCGEYRPYFDYDYCMHLIEQFGINPRKRMSGLSKGATSAVLAAIGLSSRCPLTIFDEAYLGMDAVHRNLFYKEVLADQERHPRTMILSTHLISEVEYVFDEVVMIHEGCNLSHNWDPSQQMNLQELFITLTEGK